MATNHPDPMCSSASMDWETPPDLMRAIEARWGPFDLDAAATAQNAKAPAFWTKEDDGLVQPWFGRVFVNPPYANLAGPFAERCNWAVRFGAASSVTGLFALRSDTLWFQAFVLGVPAALAEVWSKYKKKGLLPWWQTVVDWRTDDAAEPGQFMGANELHLVRGRVNFVGGPSSSTFPSVIARWTREWCGGMPEIFSFSYKRDRAARPPAREEAEA